MSNYPRWGNEKVCNEPRPCAHGDGDILPGEYMVILWIGRMECKLFHGDCSDKYDDEGNLIADSN